MDNIFMTKIESKSTAIAQSMFSYYISFVLKKFKIFVK